MKQQPTAAPRPVRGYAWLITVDHTTEWDDHKAPEGTNSNAVGMIGPSNCGLDREDFDFLTSAPDSKHAFRMKDDDGEVYYEGVYLGDASSDLAFGPLDDFGGPNAGCTSIEYKNARGEWKPL